MAGFFQTVAGGRLKGPMLAAWVVEGQAPGARALFTWNGREYETAYRDAAFPDVSVQAMQDCRRSGMASLAGERVFLEPLGGDRRLVVCGAGHVALSVIRLGAMLDYDVTVIEDRVAYAEKAREAGAGRVLCMPFGEALDAIGGGPGDAFVIMTREHVHDLDCLRRVLKRPFLYAGVMDSRSRAALIRAQLAQEGFDPEMLARVRMPIGLAIGARTPEEIAVSVAAELIQAMNAFEAGEGYSPEVLKALCEAEAGGTRAGILAMIVEKHGEAPRRPGTRMLVRPDGSALGTVGGGWAEAEILRHAREMLRDGTERSRLVRVDMQKGVMYCGGEIAVLLMPL